MGAQITDPLAARAADLYLHAGLSTRDIAAALGVGRSTVGQALRTAGVQVAPRGAGRARPRTRRPDPDDLAEQLYNLYVRQRLTRRQVSDRLGIPESRVRARLATYGIAARTRGRCNREDRLAVPAAAVTRLYRDRGLTAEATAARLGMSRAVVLRAAHEHGIAVRPGACVQDAGAIELINALYADPQVSQTLRRHSVPLVPPGGPIWWRFPNPARLTPQLCIELYVGCGVSTTHIELLTGNAEYGVRVMLHRAGVTLRRPGGRSPFLRRWQGGYAGGSRGTPPEPRPTSYRENGHVRLVDAESAQI